ncbi:Protein pop-1-like, protein [Aphelenchoides besseyi]|nr:Protein pop-1-like, protein [Aphelenchoides besseyi]
MLPFCHRRTTPPNIWNPSQILSPHFGALNLCSPQYNHPSAFMPPQMLAGYRPPFFPQPFRGTPIQLPQLPTASQNASSPSNHTPKRERMHREKRDKDHIKKPCNAFMLFMKENRSKFSNEYKVKQSSELNKEMGKAWHDLPKLEQDKYFEKAKKAKEEHTKLYPNWSARENYAINKKKRKKRERSIDPNNENNEMKKCRARFGIERQDMWCKSCRRKKRCENAPLLP